MNNLYQNLFAATFIAVGAAYEYMALSMPLGGFGSPGPGLFPMIVGGALILSAAACLIQNLVSSEPPKPPLDQAGTPVVTAKGRALNAWLLIAVLVLYVVALKPLGFPIALTLLLIASIRLFGYRNWSRTVAMAVFMTVLAYVVFIMWLKVPLPLGLLAPLLY